MQVTDLKAILDYEHNEQWLAALNCYKGIWDHNPTDDVAIRYCFFCWYLIWQWEQIDFPGEDISFEAKITVDNRMGISKAELEHTLSSIACGYYNNFQIEYKCILVHLKRLILNRPSKKGHGLQISGRMKLRHHHSKGDSKPCPRRLYS